MPKGVYYPQDLKDKVLMEVGAYQSEHKCSIKRCFVVIGEKYNIKPDTINKWYYKSRGKNLVINSVAKKRDKDTVKVSKKIAATNISTSAQAEAEKMIFDYMKKLGVFKRVLACIVGIDKLCYGSQKIY